MEKQTKVHKSYLEGHTEKSKLYAFFTFEEFTRNELLLFLLWLEKNTMIAKIGIQEEK